MRVSTKGYNKVVLLFVNHRGVYVIAAKCLLHLGPDTPACVNAMPNCTMEFEYV